LKWGVTQRGDVNRAFPGSRRDKKSLSYPSACIKEARSLQHQGGVGKRQGRARIPPCPVNDRSVLHIRTGCLQFLNRPFSLMWHRRFPRKELVEDRLERDSLGRVGGRPAFPPLPKISGTLIAVT